MKLKLDTENICNTLLPLRETDRDAEKRQWTFSGETEKKQKNAKLSVK